MSVRQWRRSGSGGRRATDHAHSITVHSTAEKPMVLFVDDDPAVCLMQAIYLKALGCQVFTAHDGSDALEHASALLPDVLVMDLAVPRLAGVAASRQIA